MSNDVTFVIGLVFGSLFGTLLGMHINKVNFRADAIKYDCAEYNINTGKFEYKEEIK